MNVSHADVNCPRAPRIHETVDYGCAIYGLNELNWAMVEWFSMRADQCWIDSLSENSFSPIFFSLPKQNQSNFLVQSEEETFILMNRSINMANTEQTSINRFRN